MAVKYYSLNKPINAEELPAREVILEIHNFDKKVYSQELGKGVWGYVIYWIEIPEEERIRCDLVQWKGTLRRALEPGDVVRINKVGHQVREILASSYTPGNMGEGSRIDCTFLNVQRRGVWYRSWIDGDDVKYFDEGNVADRLSSSTKCGVSTCCKILADCGIDLGIDAAYFTTNLDGNCYTLYQNTKKLGYLDLNKEVSPSSVDYCFHLLLRSIV